MSYYKNEEYLRNEIMGQSRHQFIYGYDNQERKDFFHKLECNNPVIIDDDFPMAIYLNNFGLPKMFSTNDEVDKTKIDIISREYLSFVIADAILRKSESCVDIDVLNSRIARLLKVLNAYSVNSGHPEICSFQELITKISESKDFYMSYYLDYVKSGTSNLLISDIAIPFLQLEYFILQYKRVLNNKSYFGIIVDKGNDVSLESIRAVNSLVAARINSDISMKIAVEPGKWDSYIAANGQYVEAIHDYGIVELDDSQTEYVRTLKKL